MSKLDLGVVGVVGERSFVGVATVEIGLVLDWERCFLLGDEDADLLSLLEKVKVRLRALDRFVDLLSSSSSTLTSVVEVSAVFFGEVAKS